MDGPPQIQIHSGVAQTEFQTLCRHINLLAVEVWRMCGGLRASGQAAAVRCPEPVTVPVGGSYGLVYTDGGDVVCCTVP